MDASSSAPAQQQQTQQQSNNNNGDEDPMPTTTGNGGEEGENGGGRRRRVRKEQTLIVKKGVLPKEMRFYELLQVEFDATEKDLIKAYRKQALKLHPDKPTGDANKFMEMKHAYDVLYDPKRRRIYDRRGERYLRLMEDKKWMELIAVEVSESCTFKLLLICCTLIPLGAILCIPILASVRWDGAPWSWALIFVPVWVYEGIGFASWLNGKVATRGTAPPPSESARMFFSHATAPEGGKVVCNWIDLEVTYFSMIGIMVVLFQAFFVARLDDTIMWSWFAVFSPSYVGDFLLICFRVHDASRQVTKIARLHASELTLLDRELSDLVLSETRLKEELARTPTSDLAGMDTIKSQLDEVVEVLNAKMEDRKKILESSEGLRVSRLYVAQAAFWPMIRIVTGLLLAAKADKRFTETWFITAIPVICGCVLWGLLETAEDIGLYPSHVIYEMANAIAVFSPHLLTWLLAMAKLDNPYIYSAFAVFGPYFFASGVIFLGITIAICLQPEKLLSPESWARHDNENNGEEDDERDVEAQDGGAAAAATGAEVPATTPPQVDNEAAIMLV